jgi:hypothetical protein
MRVTSPEAENLKHLSAAATRYAVRDEMTAFAANTLASMAQPHRGSAEVEALVDAVLVVADAHAGPHPDCPTCAAAANGISVALGVVRAETNIALTGMIGE